MRLPFWGILIVLFGFAPKQAAQADEFLLNAFPWPPYLDETAPHQGLLGAELHKFMSASGHRARLRFSPWRRALRDALEDPASDGILGIYPGDLPARLPGLTASPPLMNSTLVLVEHSDAQISWKTIEDLSLLRIGVMLDYANTPSFDRALLKGMLNIEASTDEITNLRKLAARRLDLAVMDELVFIRLRDASQQFAMLRANPHPLGSQPVIAAVRPTPRGLTLLEALTRSLGGDPPSPDLKLASQ